MRPGSDAIPEDMDASLRLAMAENKLDILLSYAVLDKATLMERELLSAPSSSQPAADASPNDPACTPWCGY